MRIEKDTQINNMVFEDIVIGNSAKVYAMGMISGDIHVESGSELYLQGVLNGYLVVEENASAYIMGVMNGDILEAEGHVELAGMLQTSRSVPVSVIKKKGCYINDKKY